MTQPFRYAPFTVRYAPIQCEAVLLVSRTTRRAGLSTISGKPRNIYERKRTPFADDLVMSISRLRREARIPTVDIRALGCYSWEMHRAAIS